MSQSDFANDPPGTVRRSTYTGTALVRDQSGWIAVYTGPDEYARHYTDIGGWNGDEDRWPVIPTYYVGEAVSRPDWDTYFLGIATAASERSDCERSKVGAVVVKDRRVRATGYNGAPAGADGCDTCPRRLAEVVPGVSPYDSGPTRCVSIHAEANALLYCDREDLVGATLYITREPCGACSKLIEATGIERVVTPNMEIIEEHHVWDTNTVALLPEPVYKFGYEMKIPEKLFTSPGQFGDLRNRSDGSDCIWCTKPPGADCRC